MPGRWSTVNPPKRPGGYTNFVAKPQIRLDSPLSGIVAMPIAADWGPENTIVELASMGDYIALYGDNDQTPGYRAVYQGFKGEAISGKGGAARILARRIVTSDGAKAIRNLANTNGTPDTDAAIVSARYEGTFAHRITVRIVANAADSVNKQDLVVYLDGSEVERYAFTKASPDTLEDLVVGSDYITVEVTNNADPLATTSALALAGGNDGTPDASDTTDWADTLTAFGTRQFSVFCPYDLTDDTLQAAVRTWAADPITGHNTKGKRFFTLLGTDDEDLNGALAVAGDLDSEDVGLVGGFTASDSTILDANGEPVVMSPSQFAPRIAGIIAATGINGSITFSRLADVTIVAGLSSDSDFVSASENGVITLAEDSNPVSPTRIEQGVTTHQGDTEQKPHEIFSSIRFVRIMGALESMITSFGESSVIGRLTISDETREYVLGELQTMVREEFVRPGAILEGFQLYVSQNPPPSDTDNFIHVVYEITLGRDVQQIRNTVVVG